MAKVIALGLFVLIAGVVAEPPVGYLPPQARGSSPSSVYGAPFGGSAGNGKASSSFRSRSGSTSISYNALHDEQSASGFGSSTGFGSSASVSQQYGAPLAGAHGASAAFKSSGSAVFGASSGSSGGFGVSQQYGAPAASAGVASFKSSGSSFGSSSGFGSSGSSFGSSSGSGSSAGFGVSQQYGAPAAGAGFGSAGSSNGFGVSQQYAAPAVAHSASGFGASSGSSFGSAGSSNGFGVSQQYGAPAVGAGAASFKSGFGASSGASGSAFGSSGRSTFSSAGKSSFGSSGSSSGFGVSQQYGAPAAGSGFGSASGARFGGVAPVYGVPNAGAYSAEEEQSEPANYEYTYEVEAADVSGVQFGHQETREDEAAKGAYHVLLPDGRIQIVEYQANEDGYQPKIRYQETAASRAQAGGASGPY